MNLLYFKEIIFFIRVFRRYVVQRSQTRNFEKQTFSLGIHILNYCLQNAYENLSTQQFLLSLKESYTKQKLFAADLYLFLIVIKLLLYCSLSFRLHSSTDFVLKNQNFFNFLVELKKIFISIILLNSEAQLANLKTKNPDNFFQKIHGKQKNRKILKIYYTYRLTFKNRIILPDKGRNESFKQYYMGYRGCSTLPELDNYYSSSKHVKKWLKDNSYDFVTKKVLGIYITEKDALLKEVEYHSKLNVDINRLFLNQARQTSSAFFYNNTGRSQTLDSNQKRSEALKGRNRFTEKGLSDLKFYQTQLRKRSESELEDLRKAALERNFRKVVCPYCNKEGQFTAMRRWHFENCKFAPNKNNEN